MKPFSTFHPCLLLLTIILSACNMGGESQAVSWALSDPTLLPGLPATFDEVAIKDPSLVYFEEKWHVFYTQAHDSVIVRSTPLENFPTGWGEPETVLKEVHEAAHVYKAKGLDEYHLIYELNTANVRSFGLAVAPTLSGPWKKVINQYASGDQLQYIGKVASWTDMVSHGEAIRTGYKQEMEYDPENCRWLIQGIRATEAQGDYSALPWKLGVIARLRVRDE